MACNLILRRVGAAAVLSLLMLGTCRAAARTGSVIYQVSLDTAALINHPAGPFSLSFQLNDGSGAGDLNNKAVVSGFQFGGGGPAGNPTLVGDARGSLSSGVTLNEGSFINFFAQPFTPGSRLSFVLLLTTNTDDGETPDQFSFSILDRTGAAVPTQAGQFFDTLVAVDISSPAPPLQVFGADGSRTAQAGGGSLNFGPLQPQAIVPAINGASASPSVIWPPDHQWVNVTIGYSANFGLVACGLGVTSNEAPAGVGDGKTSPDWQVVDEHHVRLRAERSGAGPGRVYTVGITCSDLAGNFATNSVNVSVPHDKSK